MNGKEATREFEQVKVVVTPDGKKHVQQKLVPVSERLDKKVEGSQKDDRRGEQLSEMIQREKEEDNELDNWWQK